MPIEILLNKLPSARAVGKDKWTARCPAHDDESPSLSIRQADDRVLLHCFAGCAPDAVLSAIGLTWADLYPDRWECAVKRQVKMRVSFAQQDRLDHERMILRIAAADIRAGKTLSIEDRARVQVARERVAADGR